MQLINNTKDLKQVCDRINREQNIMAVDIEFMRRNTYYAQICLVQIVAGDDYPIVIDPLEDIDLKPLVELFDNSKILKIFHSPRQDFEILYHLFRQLPDNIFDTQIAAELAGDGANLSYSVLCKKYCGIKLDKTLQMANWRERPLSDEMLEYAISDVIYLQEIYKKLSHILTKKNLKIELIKRQSELLDSRTYTGMAQKAWQKVKFYERSGEFIERMQTIAAYREECARVQNIPRLHFASDADLIKICQTLPVNDTDLKKLKLDSKYLHNNKYKDLLFDLCAGLNESD